MNKRKITILLLTAILATTVFVGCSKFENKEVAGEGSNISNSSTEEAVNQGKSFYDIEILEYKEDMFSEETTLEIDGLNAEYYFCIGNYDIWFAKNEINNTITLFFNELDNYTEILKLSFKDEANSPKLNLEIPGEDSTNIIMDVLCSSIENGQLVYINNENRVMIIDCNTSIPKIQSVPNIENAKFITNVEENIVYITGEDNNIYTVNLESFDVDKITSYYDTNAQKEVEFKELLADKEDAEVGLIYDGEYYIYTIINKEEEESLINLSMENENDKARFKTLETIE